MEVSVSLGHHEAGHGPGGQCRIRGRGHHGRRLRLPGHHYRGRYPGLHPIREELHPAHYPVGAGVERPAANRGGRRARFRVPGSARRSPRRAQSPRSGCCHHRRIRPRAVRLRPREARHQELHGKRGGRPDGGFGGPHGCGEDHYGEAADAFLRRPGRLHQDWGHRYSRFCTRRRAQPVRHGAAGYLAVPRHGAREHSLRRPFRHR